MASHRALIEKYEMVPQKELLSHENHLHFDFSSYCWNTGTQKLVGIVIMDGLDRQPRMKL